MKQGTEAQNEAQSTGRKLPCFPASPRRAVSSSPTSSPARGTKFTALYVTRFNIMEEREKAAIGGKTAKSGKTPEELAAADKRATAMLLNAKNRERRVSFKKLYDRAGTKARVSGNGSQRFLFQGWGSPPRMAFQDMKQTYDKSAIAEKLGVYSKASGGKVPPCPGHWCDYLHAGYLGGRARTASLLQQRARRRGITSIPKAWSRRCGHGLGEGTARPRLGGLAPVLQRGKGNYAVVYKEGMGIAEQALWDKKGGVTMNKINADGPGSSRTFPSRYLHHLSTDYEPNGLPDTNLGDCIRFKEDEVERGIWRLKRSSRLSARKVVQIRKVSVQAGYEGGEFIRTLQ